LIVTLFIALLVLIPSRLPDLARERDRESRTLRMPWTTIRVNLLRLEKTARPQLRSQIRSRYCSSAILTS